MILNQDAEPCSRNIELKAKYRDLAIAQELLRPLNPMDGGVQNQIDTYFRVPFGRLKLREIVGVKAELIWYDRSDQSVSRRSDYRLIPTAHPLELKTGLAAALGVRGEVRKRRQILLWHNVRIHLDEVQQLGTFIEFEAVMSAGEDEATGHARLAELCRVLSIPPGDHLARSYSDLRGL